MDNYIMMYEKLPNLVLGFHGCDISTYKKVLKEYEIRKAGCNRGGNRSGILSESDRLSQCRCAGQRI